MTLAEKVKGLAVKEPHDVYLAHPAMSAGKLKTLYESPRAFYRRYMEKREDKVTPAKLFGITAHAALLEPRRFLDNYVIEPDLRRNTNDYKAWRAGLPPTAIVLSEEDGERIVSMCESVQLHETACALLRGGTPEHSLYFTEPKTGVKCRVRPDMLTEDGYIVDIKSTLNGEREAFGYQSWDLRYDISVGLYTMAFREVFGQEPKGYVFIAIENREPFDCYVYVADQMMVEVGTEDTLKMLELHKECSASKQWPGKQRGQAENLALPYKALVGR